MNVIGEKIRKHRKIKGLTQEELAEKSDLSTMSIRRYESGERVPPQDTLLKIAKALDVHLRNLMDSSILEDFDKQHSEVGEKYAHYKAVNNHLRKMGFIVSERVTKWHWENEADSPEERIQIPDEFETTLSKDGYTAIFTEEEFEELQAGAKEAIEGKFYKKVLEQQKRNNPSVTLV